MRFAFFSLLLLAHTAWAVEAPCNAETPVGEYCQLSIEALRPTQSAVGEMQVDYEVGTIRKQADLIAWQKKKVIPVVISPEGDFFLTDRHHTSRGLWRAGEKSLVVKIIARLKDSARFWDEMQAHHWVYLHDERGTPIQPEALPRRIAELRDDPYRSLAGFARNRGHFKGTEAFFMEFEWARYFGEAMNWQPIRPCNLEKALKKTRKLACAPAAQTLPGYDAATCAAGTGSR